jgi:peptidylprolyl isomerase
MRSVEKAVMLLLLMTAVLIFACSQKDASVVTPGLGGETASEKHPANNSNQTITTPSGLQYEDLVAGSGDSPKKGKKVTVHYTGWLMNGTKFDSSLDRNEPFVFTIGAGEVIPGWDEGVMTMKIGGKRKLIVPASLGYGAAGAGGVIPPNATLVFEVILLDVR